MSSSRFPTCWDTVGIGIPLWLLQFFWLDVGFPVTDGDFWLDFASDDILFLMKKVELEIEIEIEIENGGKMSWESLILMMLLLGCCCCCC